MHLLWLALSLLSFHALIGTVIMALSHNHIPQFREGSRKLPISNFLGLWLYFAFAWSLVLYRSVSERLREAR